MVRTLKLLLVYWHLLSLDAPTVAILWTWFIARVNHVPLTSSALTAMATAVWMLYAADRLLDVRGTDSSEFEERHYFHLRHRKSFLAGIAVASLALALLLPRIPAEAMKLYLVLGGMVAGYFVVIHATDSAHRLPKEIAVGVCFAAAVFIPTVARASQLRLPLLAPAALLAMLCSLNCLFIYAWEHPERRLQKPHPMTAAAIRHLHLTAGAVAIVSLALIFFQHGSVWPLYLAIALSATGLLMLHRSHQRHGAVTMRAFADLALLSPMVMVLFL